MSELGLAIVGAVDTGLKLSFGFYQLATDLADAGLEIQALGADVSMTCNALNQVHTVLTRARGCRASTAAIDAAQETVTRCKAIFNQMETVYKSLQSDTQGKTGTTRRIKWVLKKPRLRLLQQSLQACVAMLQLMVASLNLSHDIANGSLVPNSAEETRRLSINAGLLLAQQAVNQQLETVEEEYQQSAADEDSDVIGPLEPNFAQQRRTLSANGGYRVAHNRHSRIVGGEILRELPQPVRLQRAERPTSSVLHKLLHWNNPYVTLNRSRLSASTFDDTLDLSRELQQRWTAGPGDIADANADDGADLSGDSLHENMIRAPVHYPTVQSQRRPMPDSPVVDRNIARVANLKPQAEDSAFDEDARWPTDQRTTAPSDERALLESQETFKGGAATETTSKPAGDAEHGIIETAIVINNIPKSLGKTTLLGHLTNLDLPFPCTMILRSPDGVSTAHAIAIFDSPQEATQVINCLDSSQLASNKLQVEHMKTPVPTFNPSANADTPPVSPTPIRTPNTPSLDVFKSFKVSLEDPCWKLLSTALNKPNIHADWKQYSLSIVYGDKERSVGFEEKPLVLFKELEQGGKRPMFMLKKIASPTEPPPGWVAEEAGRGTGIGDRIGDGETIRLSRTDTTEYPLPGAMF